MFIEKFSKNIPVFDSDELNDILPYMPWAGHRVFAYDLIKKVEPDTVVELGTHYGCSLFAFAQSIKDFSLNTELFAIDTWEGDHQAGHYGEEVFESIKNTQNKYYKDIKLKLLRCYFHEGLNNFENNSVDILHIDGCHDYENVCEDFKMWLPKVKDDGIILFHDIAERSGYGSAKHWDEIKNTYNSYLEFNNDWGLGVLFLSDKKFNNVSKHLDFEKYYEINNQLTDKYKIEIIDKYYHLQSQNRHIKNQENHIDTLTEKFTEVVKHSLLLELKLDQVQNIVIYGTGGFSKDIYKLIVKNGLKVDLFVDSNENLWGKKMFDTEIVSINEAANRGYNKYLIGSYSYASEISEIIENEYAARDKTVKIFSANSI
jgi:predicted O-methyltransferase YrrM